MAKGQNYITVKIDSFDDGTLAWAKGIRPGRAGACTRDPIVKLIVGGLVSLCAARVHSIVGQLVCFQCDDTDDNFDEVIKKVRRLGRGKLRYTLWRR